MADDTIRGELTGFRTRTSDGWGVGTVRTDAGDEHTVTGKLLGVGIGDAVVLAGVWVDSRYGRQFKVKQCTATVPQTTAGVVAWMSSVLPGVGGVRAAAMVARFGIAGLWDTIESAPRELCVIDGITPDRADAIAAAYQTQRADRDAMIVLRGWGLTDRQVERCLERWPTVQEVVDVVRADAYVLMEQVTGFGFTRADHVALRAGMPPDSPLRIAAALQHLVAEEVHNGHCFVLQGQLRQMALKLLEVPEDLVRSVMHQQYARQRLLVRAQRVYLPQLDHAEDTCASTIGRYLALQGVGTA